MSSIGDKIKIDTEKATEKIVAETGTDIDTARAMAERLDKLHSDLAPVVEAWLEGREVPFESSGISLEKLMHHYGCKYFYALFAMSTILEDPSLASIYSYPQVFE
jgi:hypothetical protein